jgi:hypothetical protein
MTEHEWLALEIGDIIKPINHNLYRPDVRLLMIGKDPSIKTILHFKPLVGHYSNGTKVKLTQQLGSYFNYEKIC